MALAYPPIRFLPDHGQLLDQPVEVLRFDMVGDYTHGGMRRVKIVCDGLTLDTKFYGFDWKETN